MHSRHLLILPALLAACALAVPAAATAEREPPARPAAAASGAAEAPDSAAAIVGVRAPTDTSGLIHGPRPPRLRLPTSRLPGNPDTLGAFPDSLPGDSTAVDTASGAGPGRGAGHAPNLLSAADSAVAFPVYEKPGEADPRFAPGASSDSTPPPAIAYPRPKPYSVMLRSALLPGWGQLTNGKWWKAVLVAGLEGYLAGSAVSAGRDVGRAEDSLRAAPTLDDSLSIGISLQSARDRRAGFIWWTVGAVGLSMLDAYVDAHFKNFDVTPVTALPGRRGQAFLGLRVGWRRGSAHGAE
ncbi:MAG: hypothetical protein HZB25_00090 [Candidatus Eisenbacteria bacterium]|nr:hypothetical protein [Candidatus Eisenbacteria bacterium]